MDGNPKVGGCIDAVAWISVDSKYCVASDKCSTGKLVSIKNYSVESRSFLRVT